MLQTLKQFFETHKLTINAIFLVALASLAFVYPFDSNFRFTIGIVVLSTLLLYFRSLPIFSFTIFSGLSIVIVRTIIYESSNQFGMEEAIIRNLPAFFYYAAFGLLFHIFQLRNKTDNIPILILLLSLTDITSNVVEILIRAELTGKNIENVFSRIILVAIVRAVLAAYGYYALKKYHAFVLAEDQLARYTRLTMLIAKLNAELFYLKKSSQDIETVMEQSYWLYNHLQHVLRGKPLDEAQAAQALTIARSIHEVKKDYTRVISGIEKIVEPSARSEGLQLSEILFIIEQNTTRYLSSIEKNITITFECRDDFVTDKHYIIASILDNLITNAIEATAIDGTIKVCQECRNDMVVFSVEDAGIGIAPEDYELIFEPGYSTKFSTEDGRMSTGLGLAHVRNLTAALNGEIHIQSEAGRFTLFTIQIPYQRLALTP